jgi:hypothetical protein
LPPYYRSACVAQPWLPCSCLSRRSRRHTCACRERARMCENGERVCGAHRRNDLDHSGRRRASRPCCLARID